MADATIAEKVEEIAAGGAGKNTTKIRSPKASDKEWAALLLDEWKFRQSHCWRLLQVFGIAAVAVSIAPYLLSDIRTGPGYLVLAFPIFGLLVAMVVLALFRAEYKQCDIVLKTYRKLQEGNDEFYYPYKQWPMWFPIGRWLPPALLLLVFVGSFGNALILIAPKCQSVNPGWACGWAAVIRDLWNWLWLIGGA